jgi:hypothetical protein
MAMAGSSDWIWAGLPAWNHHDARSSQSADDGIVEKMEGPALRGEAAVYAAKARHPPIDCEHGVIA